MQLTERLTNGVRTALAKAGLPEPQECAWEVPRQAEHGDYATNVAMVAGARGAAPAAADRRGDREALPGDARGRAARGRGARLPQRRSCRRPGARGRCATILAAGAALRARRRAWPASACGWSSSPRIPPGPLVIVNARAAAIGDALARLLRAQGARVTTEYYINDAGNQFEALARSFEARVRQALGETAPLPENGYPGEYLIDLAASTYRARAGDAGRLDAHLARRRAPAGRPSSSVATRWRAWWRASGACCADYGVRVRRVDVRAARRARHAGCPSAVLDELAARGLTYEQDGALWFRSTEWGEAADDKDRVLRRSQRRADLLRASTSPITTT